MHVITLNGKPVTVKTMAIAFGWSKDGFKKEYMIAVDAKKAKEMYFWITGSNWKNRHLGIECRRLTKEDVV